MTGRDTADPDIGPRGWNCECLNSFDLMSIPEPASVAVDIIKARAIRPTSKAGLLVQDILQFGKAGQFFGRKRVNREHFCRHEIFKSWLSVFLLAVRWT